MIIIDIFFIDGCILPIILGLSIFLAFKQWYDGRMKKTLLYHLGVSIVPPLVVLLLQIARVQFFPGHGELDNVAHFFGGFSIAWMFTIIVQALREQPHLLWGRAVIPSPTPTWLTDFTVWGTVALVGIAWEFMEFGMDAMYGFHMQPSLTDTMGDLLCDLCGGLLFLVIYRLLVRKN